MDLSVEVQDWNRKLSETKIELFVGFESYVKILFQT